MTVTTIKDDYWVVGAGHEAGPVYLSDAGAMTARPHLARRFASDADARAGLPDARRIPAGKDLDWRVFGVHSETMVTPV